MATPPTLRPETPPTLRPDWRDVPHPKRVRRDADRAEILRRHAAAIDRGLPVYTDPVSALTVFTADFLARRGYCCDSGCRHCPYVPLHADDVAVDRNESAAP
jgi:hypothetical protein